MLAPSPGVGWGWGFPALSVFLRFPCAVGVTGPPGSSCLLAASLGLSLAQALMGAWAGVSSSPSFLSPDLPVGFSPLLRASAFSAGSRSSKADLGIQTVNPTVSIAAGFRAAA